MDIVLSGQETDTELVIGKSVALVANTKELKQTASTLVLATTTERALIQGPIDGILFSDSKGKDHLHYRRGILDEVSAKILAADKKALVIGLETVLHGVPRALGRALQDAELAATHGADVVFVSLGNEYAPTPHDLCASFRALGFPEKLVARNKKTLSEWIARAQHRTTPEYLGEGISKAKGI